MGRRPPNLARRDSEESLMSTPVEGFGGCKNAEGVETDGASDDEARRRGDIDMAEAAGVSQERSWSKPP